MSNPSSPAQAAIAERLKPCPFCGAPGYLVGGVTTYEVKCTDTDCTARGREVPNKREAIAAWNRRSAPSSAQAEGRSILCPERSAKDMRRFAALWRYGSQVLPGESASTRAFDSWLFQLDMLIDGKTHGLPFEECPPLASAQAEPAASAGERDRDWILAMGHALGLDSVFRIPIVPSVDEFKKLFAAVRARAAVPLEQQQAGEWREPQPVKVEDLSEAQEALTHITYASEMDLSHQGKALQDFAIPALSWALQCLGEPMDAEGWSEHELGIIRDLEALGRKRDVGFWPSAIALGAVGIIKRAQAKLVVAPQPAVEQQAVEIGAVAWREAYGAMERIACRQTDPENDALFSTLRAYFNHPRGPAAQQVRALTELMDALGALTDPEEKLDSAINPGPERDSLQAVYNRIRSGA